MLKKKLSFNIGERDLLDGSIGKHWSNFRKSELWAQPTKTFLYQFPDSDICQPKCYQNSELLYFRDWLSKVYQPELLPKYLESKYQIAKI